MSGMKDKMIDFEKMVDEHCNIEYMNSDGTEIVKTSKASLMIAFEEYLKLYESEPVKEPETTKANLNIADVSICICGTNKYRKPMMVMNKWECGKCNKPY